MCCGSNSGGCSSLVVAEMVAVVIGVMVLADAGGMVVVVGVGEIVVVVGRIVGGMAAVVGSMAVG